jgi:ribosomal protein S15P/S13E
VALLTARIGGLEDHFVQHKQGLTRERIPQEFPVRRTHRHPRDG